MSKITAKNLSYDSTLPPFLARLHANQAFTDGRHESQDKRRRNNRNPEDEAEDEPVYFDEKTAHTLTKKEWEAKQVEGASGKIEEPTENKNDAVRDTDSAINAQKAKARSIAIGIGRKRRAERIVCLEENLDKLPDVLHPQLSVNKSVEITSEKLETRNTDHSKGGKKKKKIKLSFDD